jgi:SAM-dependent methyltransferase
MTPPTFNGIAMAENNAFDQWCANIAELRKTGDGLWSLATLSTESFPSNGHTILADIEPHSYWFNHRNDVIAAAVIRFPPQGWIFDIGGGNGYVSFGLRKAGFECIVVEPGPVGAANAVARDIPTICAAFQNLELADSSIPAAGLFDVLEHIEDDAAALANLHRVIMPGGRVYLAVPAHRALWSEEDVFAGHFRRYTLSSLRCRLEQAGFSVEYETYFFSVLLVPVFLFRVLLAPFRSRTPANTERTAHDHTLPSGVVRTFFRHAFRRELAKIALGKSLGIGASCLIVARK